MMAYLACLCVCIFMAAAMRKRAMLRTGIAIFMNWAACSLIVMWTGDFTPWAWWFVFDAIAAAVVLAQPAGRMQAMIGAIYIAQLLIHIGYDLSGNSYAQYDYWLMLTRLSWAQLTLFGAWGAGVGGRLAYHGWRRHHYQVADRSRIAGME